jgi:predicted metal-dependent phosphotriesterase family hydrolase
VYAKTVTVFAPMLLEAGLDEQTVRQFTTSNPRRWLAFQPRSG